MLISQSKAVVKLHATSIRSVTRYLYTAKHECHMKRHMKTASCNMYSGSVNRSTSVPLYPGSHLFIVLATVHRENRLLVHEGSPSQDDVELATVVGVRFTLHQQSTGHNAVGRRTTPSKNPQHQRSQCSCPICVEAYMYGKRHSHTQLLEDNSSEKQTDQMKCNMICSHVQHGCSHASMICHHFTQCWCAQASILKLPAFKSWSCHAVHYLRWCTKAKPE